jgi:hypothetical protein
MAADTASRESRIIEGNEAPRGSCKRLVEWFDTGQRQIVAPLANHSSLDAAVA